MNPIHAADPESKKVYTFTDVGSLHHAIKSYGYIPLHPDGTPFDTQYLAEYDGYVLDGAPLNVWLDGEWLEGQREAMEPFWASGKIRRPTPAILNVQVTPMPEETAARTAAYQEASKEGKLFGMDMGTVVAIGAGLIALWWVSK